MIPTHYLYLTDPNTGDVDALFPTDHLHSFADLSGYEAELRVAHGLDQPGASCVLRSSYTAPLLREHLATLAGGMPARRRLRPVGAWLRLKRCALKRV